eukprot:COSAG01_NODE_9499_length_2431_cov_1.239708_4_plen_65_part_01
MAFGSHAAQASQLPLDVPSPSLATITFMPSSQPAAAAAQAEADEAKNLEAQQEVQSELDRQAAER